MMYIRLTDSITVAFIGDDAAVVRYLGHLFAGWETAAPVAAPSLTLHIVVGELPPPPAAPPIFVDHRHDLASFGNLSVFGDPAAPLLWFVDGGWVQLTAADSATAEVWVTPSMVNSGRFEDVLFLTLAHFLRRQELYLVHAFGAAGPAGRGVLIVGPSGSGKTTTGLNLLTGGWHLLANDAVLLHQRPQGIYALPTPGLVSIRPRTFAILPELIPFLRLRRVPQEALWLSATHFGPPASAAPIRQIYFTQVAGQPTSTLEPLNKAVALAHLLEESVDRWDAPTTAAHIALLEQLVGQAAVYQLHLGRDTAQTRQLLIANC